MYSILEKGYLTLQKSIGEQKRIHFNQGKGCRHLFILVLFLLISYTGSAATYYISNSGNDSKAGTTPETAWKTISQVNKTKFAPGDQILFNRGDMWRGETLELKWSGLKGNPIVFGAYGIGVKPIFNGAEIISLWTPVHGKPNIWVTHSPMNDTHDAPRSFRTVVVIDNDRFMPVNSLKDLNADLEYFTVDKTGSTGDSLYVYSITDPSSRTAELSTKLFGISDGLSGTGVHQYINIKDLNFRYYGYAGIDIRGTQPNGNYLIDNCIFYFNRYHGVHIYSGHENNIVQNSTVSYCGNGLYADEADNNSFIRNNITNTISYGIDPGTTDGHAIGIWSSKGVLVEYNHIIGGVDGGAVLGMDYASAVVRYNEVHSQNVQGAIGIHRVASGGKIDIYYNILFGDIPKGYCMTIGTVDGEVNVFNNTMIQNVYTVVMSIFNGNNLVMKNNIFYNIGASWSMLYTTDKGSMGSDYNLWYNKDGKSIYFVQSPGVYHKTLASWQTASSQDTHSIDADPMVRIESTDLSLKRGSPAINAGVDVGLTHDILGNPIVGNPDLGAYEYGASVEPEIPLVNLKQGSVGTHYIPAGQGETEINPMNLTIVSAMLEDQPLSADDEIAVFSGAICVGSAKLTQPIDATNRSTSLSISASQADGSNKGYITNDTIVFKIWNNQTQHELQVNAVIYRNDVSTCKTNGRYSPGATAAVEIASYPVYTQQIEILKGYNLISTYVSPQNSSVSAVTSTLIDQGNLIKMQDEAGNSFENWGAFGGWINQLGSLKETEGYQLQAANNCTLQVTGRSIATPLDISLKTGWNIISYPRTDAVNAMDVVQTLIDQNKLLKVQDEQGNSIENWQLYGGWKNGIGNLIPGKAYKVKMSADAILAFQKSYPKSALVTAKPEQTEFYHSSVEGNGTDHMNINITDLNTIGLSAGDELAAFDGAVCVATIKITEANVLSGSACLAASFSTDTQKPNGFKVGNPIQIRTWNKLKGNESKVNAEVITGQMKYEKNASVLVKMKSASLATGINNLNDVVKIDVFPNPCRGKFTVRLSENPEQGSRIDVLDISGHTVASRLISEPSEVFNLGNQPSGLYLVRTTIGTSQKNYKLIIN